MTRVTGNRIGRAGSRKVVLPAAEEEETKLPQNQSANVYTCCRAWIKHALQIQIAIGAPPVRRISSVKASITKGKDNQLTFITKVESEEERPACRRRSVKTCCHTL